MNRKDVVELIRREMPDLTDGPFDVKIENDDGGAHICICVEFHEDSPGIMQKLYKFHNNRIIIKNVPEGWLNSLVTPRKD